jgi:predicted nuclease of restriction endonuclease-like (RecB) superfamily
MNEITVSNLYSKISELLNSARQTVVRAVNQTMVHTYYEIGRVIVEDNQQGKERAEYGKQILKELSKRLNIEFGKGFSERNLEQMRRFYLTYSIPQKSSAKLQHAENKEIISRKTVLPKFVLSWSHYLKLMRIENPDERNFYEIECAENNWSLKELQRQFDSALYERLALSRDKEGVRHLAQQGQIIEKPADLLKDPQAEFVLKWPE